MGFVGLVEAVRDNCEWTSGFCKRFLLSIILFLRITRKRGRRSIGAQRKPGRITRKRQEKQDLFFSPARPFSQRRGSCVSAQTTRFDTLCSRRSWRAYQAALFSNYRTARVHFVLCFACRWPRSRRPRLTNEAVSQKKSRASSCVRSIFFCLFLLRH